MKTKTKPMKMNHNLKPKDLTLVAFGCLAITFICVFALAYKLVDVETRGYEAGQVDCQLGKIEYRVVVHGADTITHKVDLPIIRVRSE